MLSDIRNRERKKANTYTWGRITRGVLGKRGINADKLGIEGARSTDHTLIGFDTNSELLTVRLPESKVTGARALFGDLKTLSPSRALDLLTIRNCADTWGASDHQIQCGEFVWGL